MGRKAYVDESECTGCELCVDTLPEVFEMNGDVCHVHNSNGASEDKIQEVMDDCPSECIKWEE